MKIKLVDVLALGEAMKRLEAAGMEFTPVGAIRYSRHRRAVFSHVDPVIESIREQYEKTGERTQEAAFKAQQTVIAALDGEEIELQLPPPIPDDAILKLPVAAPEDHLALSKLVDVVIGTCEEEP